MNDRQLTGEGRTLVTGTGQVRVVSREGSVWGAGVLLSDWAVTCAHVVTAAVGRPGAHGDVVWLDMPGSRNPPVKGVVLEDGWRPAPVDAKDGALASHIDLAVLALPEGRPAEWQSASLAPAGPEPGRRLRVMGYPPGSEGGVWVSAEIAGPGGLHSRWVQLDGLSPVGARVERGFSGAPVWDTRTACCVGLLTAAMVDPATHVAWMVPAEAMAECWPALSAAPVPAPRPPKNEPPAVATLFMITDGLLRVPQIEGDGGRTLRDLLPETIRHQVYEHPESRLRLFRIVQACSRFPYGREALIEAVSLLGGSSTATLDALDTLRRSWRAPDGERGGGL
ncbi:trypsin-like peptidase domain-containing protein [Streptomyces sp. NPDC004542]|uniref:effector-associated domain 2-containing protein n=1 Tax=Streptomyces sp. NPDC004542 TaxID=3154281 RepID=UPI0033BAA6A8